MEVNIMTKQSFFSSGIQYAATARDTTTRVSFCLSSAFPMLRHQPHTESPPLCPPPPLPLPTLKVRGRGILVSVRVPLVSASASHFFYLLLLPLEPVGRISLNMYGYIIGTSLRADKLLVTLTLFFKRSKMLKMPCSHSIS